MMNMIANPNEPVSWPAKRQDTRIGSGPRRVIIQCPIGGGAVLTGVEMDTEAFAAAKLSDYVTLCSSCGAAHSWAKVNVALES